MMDWSPNASNEASSPASPNSKMEDYIERELQETQNIFLIFRGGEQESEAPTFAPTPKPETRTVNFRTCDISSAEETDSGLAGVADIHFVYDIETTKAVTQAEEEAILESLESAMIDSIHAFTCRRRRGLRIQGLHSEEIETGATDGQRRLEIETISSGNRDQWQGECATTSDVSKFCNRYDGTISLGFNDFGENDSAMEVGNTALGIVSKDMVDGNYLDSLNAALGLSSVGNTTTGEVTTSVTRVSYVGTSFYDSNDGTVIAGLGSTSFTADDGRDGLTTLGNLLVPVVCILFVAMLSMLYMSYRSHQRHKNRLILRFPGDASDDEDVFRDEYGKKDKTENNLSNTYSIKSDCSACSKSLPPPPPPEEEGVEILRPFDEVTEGQSLTSSLTGGRSLSNGFGLFGRKQAAPTIQILEEVAGDNDSYSFRDEPNSVNLVRVAEDDICLQGTAKKRQVVDHQGYVRNEIEL